MKHAHQMVVNGHARLHVLSPSANQAGLRTSFEKARYQRFVIETGWECANSEHREHDEFDPNAPYIVLEKDGRVVAGCRLLLRRLIGKLPVEEYLSNHVVPDNGIEISRMLTLPEGRAHMNALYGFMLSWLVEMQIEFVYMTIRERYLRALERRGFRCFEALPVRSPLRKVGNNGQEDLFFPIRMPLGRVQEVFALLELAA